jgi:hypothetical protein
LIRKKTEDTRIPYSPHPLHEILSIHRRTMKDLPPSDGLSGETTVNIDMDEIESHTTKPSSPSPKISPRIISDAILGLSDGLTVPFALTAGLSALGTSRLVVLGGLAELMAGAISMGLGGFVGAKSEA